MHAVYLYVNFCIIISNVRGVVLGCVLRVNMRETHDDDHHHEQHRRGMRV